MGSSTARLTLVFTVNTAAVERNPRRHTILVMVHACIYPHLRRLHDLSCDIGTLLWAGRPHLIYLSGLNSLFCFSWVI